MKKRDKKKRDKKQWQEHRRLEKKQRLEHVLVVLDVLEGFRALPAWLREEVVQLLPDGPAIVIEASVRDRADMKALKKEVEEALDRSRLQTDEGDVFPCNDFVSACWALPGVFSYMASQPLPQKYHPFLEGAATKATAFQKEWRARMDHAVVVEIFGTLLKSSRIDQGVFGGALVAEAMRSGKPVFQVTLIRGGPREARVVIDGKRRPAFWCGLPNYLDGIGWMEADGGHFGLEKGRKYPVFIQSHALVKLKERFPADRDVQGVVQYGLLESLSNLKVVERQGDAYLIGYHLRGCRVGYLVARVVEDRIVIVTFLFLTMKGTPEAGLLYEKLRLCRRDIEHLDLHRLETFLSPDVLQDEELVRVLEECGCGSLLELARMKFPYEVTRYAAEELKRFLGIGPQGGRVLLGQCCWVPPEKG